MFRRCNNTGILLFSVVLLSLGAAAPLPDLIAIAHGGESLSTEDIEQLSLPLLKTPDDAGLHAKLLGYYLARKSDEHGPRDKQIVWMIDHHAADAIAGSPYCLIDAIDDPEGYAKAKGAWDQQLGGHSTDVQILANGAAFLARNNFNEADNLLQQTTALEPKNAIWPERLAQLYERQMANHSEDAARLSSLALQLRQLAYNLTKDPTYRFHVLLLMPSDSLRGGDLIQSKRLGRQLLDTAAKFKNDPAYGDAVHQANIALGETALQAGNLEQADSYLAAAAQTPGSVTLASTGPDFHLAKELVARGERTAVHDYLIACGKFWPAGTARLKSWTATLDSGGTPDF